MNLNLGDTQMIIEAGRKAGLLRNQLAYVLATAYHETAHSMKPIKETVMVHHKDKNPSDATVISRLNSAFSKGLLGNVKTKYWVDGYFGRGFVQLTHKTNYDKFKVSKDDALKPSVAAGVIIKGMKEGMFTGKRLSQYITLQKSDFFNARDIVNPDKNYKPKGASLSIGGQIEVYAKEYDALLKQSGYGEDATSAKEITKEGIIVAAGVSVVAGLWYALSFIPCKLLGVLCG